MNYSQLRVYLNETTDDIYCLNDVKSALNFNVIHLSRVLFELETPIYTADRCP